jgi:hypothetical protein
MCKLIIINGGHSTGKTTLIKNIVNFYDNNFVEIKTEFGYYTKLNENIYFVGKVTTKTTGGDQCGYNNIFTIILTILNKEKNINAIILESPIFSSNFSKPIKFLSYLKLNYEINIINILLFVENMDIIFNRCYNRTGKELTDNQKHHVISQQKGVQNSFIKKQLLYWINNYIINIENKNEENLLKNIIEFLK